MIEFQRTVTQSEVRSTYLNLTDDYGRRFGRNFPEHRTKLVVIDGAGRQSRAQKHGDNQLWGAVKNWFNDNRIAPGTRVRVRFDPNERREGLQVVHLMPETGPVPHAVPTPEAEPIREPTSEIPLGLEKQLEDFLASNLPLIEPGLALCRDDEGREGKQYPTDVGLIDLLCRRPNGDLLVVELKRSKSSDVAVGQISRYIGWVKRHVATDEAVSGLILTHDRDESLEYAVLAHPNLALRYFRLRLELVSEEQL
ncbi:MAG: endonuclease NucS [Acidobacteria bacterium]|nr:endonuclease NucS [Acidobacteriota bacterium]